MSDSTKAIAAYHMIEKAKELLHESKPSSVAPVSGSTDRVDIEIRVHPQPYSGTHRALGGIHPGTYRDDKAVAAALRKIADEIDPPNNKLSNGASK